MCFLCFCVTAGQLKWMIGWLWKDTHILLWAPQTKLNLPPEYWRGGRNLRTWTNKTKTFWISLGINEKIFSVIWVKRPFIWEHMAVCEVWTTMTVNASLPLLNDLLHNCLIIQLPAGIGFLECSTLLREPYHTLSRTLKHWQIIIDRQQPIKLWSFFLFFYYFNKRHEQRLQAWLSLVRQFSSGSLRQLENVKAHL